MKPPASLEAALQSAPSYQVKARVSRRLALVKTTLPEYHLRNMSPTVRQGARRGIRLLIAMVAAPLALYLLGYFLFMDRSLPTSSFRHDEHYFDSSYRWAAKQNSQKAGPPDTPWPNATGWNDLYAPLDRVYFKFFPRSDAEIARLRRIGCS